MISLPTVAKGLGTDILGISWALIAYQVAGIGLGVICGRLGDIYGHERVYGFGIVTMAISSAGLHRMFSSSSRFGLCREWALPLFSPAVAP